MRRERLEHVHRAGDHAARESDDEIRLLAAQGVVHGGRRVSRLDVTLPQECIGDTQMDLAALSGGQDFRGGILQQWRRAQPTSHWGTLCKVEGNWP